MKKNMWNKALIFFLVLGMAGCKARKQVILPPVSKAPVIKVDDKKDKLESIAKGQADFQFVSIKADAEMNIDNNNNDVSMNIRIKKDEMIWVSVTAIAGLEVARAVITPDSVKILNRLDNIYIKKPFSYIYEFTNNQINFRTLQSILVGNTISEFVTDKAELLMQGGQATLSGVLKSLIYSTRLNEHNKVLQTSLNDDEAQQNMVVYYGEFNPVSGREIPHLVNLKTQVANKNIQLNLRYTKIGIDEILDFPFTVPKRFSVKN